MSCRGRMVTFEMKIVLGFDFLHADQELDLGLC